MGGKKQGMRVLTGSLKSHWMKYVTELHMTLNPTDRKALVMCNYVLGQLKSVKPHFVQPGFIWSADVAKDCKFTTPSILHMKFLCGYERKYHMGLHPFEVYQR